MLSEETKREIRGEIFRGNPQMMLEKSRRLDDPPYYQTLFFMLDTLRSYHNVPDGKNCVFYFSFDPRYGPVSTCGAWHDGGFSFIQFEGNATRYPDAPLPEHLAASAAAIESAKISGIRYRPRRETRRAAAIGMKSDFKLAQAGDRE